ncbi:MAG: DUF4229 domain-containing protein [Actinomycetes bacterium]
MSRVPPVITYSVLRLLLFVVPFGILLAVQVPPVWALLVAFLLSAVVSLFALNAQRDAMSISVAQRSERVKAAMAERTAAEDAWDDEQRTGQQPTGGDPPQPTDDSKS